MSNGGNIWRFPTLPSGPSAFDPSSSIFRSYELGLTNYNCILCSHDPEMFYSYEEMLHHCKDANHFTCVQDLLTKHKSAKAGLLECLSRHKEIEPRIKLLGLPAWRDKVRADLCLYFGSTGNDIAAFTRAVNNVFKYEHMERISLLELAAWKASCILDTDDENKKMLHETLEWVHHGWMKNKTKMRRSTATTVIVENVLCFLERPRTMASARECLDMFTPSM